MFANLSTHAVHTLHALGVPTSLIHEFNATQINASFLLLQSSYSSTRCIPCGMRSYVAKAYTFHIQIVRLISYIYGELRNTSPDVLRFFLKNLSVLTLALFGRRAF